MNLPKKNLLLILATIVMSATAQASDTGFGSGTYIPPHTVTHNITNPSHVHFIRDLIRAQPEQRRYSVVNLRCGIHPNFGPTCALTVDYTNARGSFVSEFVELNDQDSTDLYNILMVSGVTGFKGSTQVLATEMDVPAFRVHRINCEISSCDLIVHL